MTWTAAPASISMAAMVAFGQCANSRDNGFHLLRISAACLVILSHCFAISAVHGSEPGLWATRTLTLGSLGVFIFFTISGFLIAKSYQETPSLGGYARKRIARILPGLAAAVFFAALVVGPLTTRLSLADYLTRGKTWGYLWHNLTLYQVHHSLPGVFETRPFPNVVNGSLWSLTVEVYMYLLLPLLAAAAWRLGRLRGAALPLLAVAMFFVQWRWLPEDQTQVLCYLPVQASFLCAFHFLLGAMFFVYRAAIPRSRTLAVAALLVWAASWRTPACSLVELLTVPYVVLFLGFARVGPLAYAARFGNPSYGLYVYAFPIQQCIVGLWPRIAPLPLFLLATPATAVLAYASWHLLEKRVLQRARAKAAACHDRDRRAVVPSPHVAGPAQPWHGIHPQQRESLR